MSRRSPPALPLQPEDPVPVEHDSDDGDGGALMVDAWPASLHFSSMSPPRLLPPCSAWATMVVVGHLPPSPPRSPTGSIQLLEFDDAQQLPLQMASTANCSAAILEAAPQDTSYRIATSKTIFLLFGMNITKAGTAHRLRGRKNFIHLWKIAVELPAGIRVLEKIFLSHGLEIHMNTETGGSSLAMIESYDDVSDLINCVRINRVRARRRGPASVLSMEQLAAVICYRAKTFKSYGLEIYMNTETGGTSLPMIESYDDDNEIGEIPPLGHFHPEFFSLLPTVHLWKKTKQLFSAMRDMAKTFLSRGRGLEIGMNFETGRRFVARIETGRRLVALTGSRSVYRGGLDDNDAEQSEIPWKCLRSRSLVWLHFAKVFSKDSGVVTAMCKHCNNALKGASTLGTSHLLRHLKNVHQMDLSSLSEAWKEPQRSSCSQKLENTGSAACAGIPTPLTENNGNELQDKDFELGDTSRKRLKGTSRTKSDVWLHFTKLHSADPSGVMAKCNHCKKTLKAGSQNGTSSLRRHLKKVHQMDLSSMVDKEDPIRFSSMSQRSPPALPPQPEDLAPVEHDSSDGDRDAWMVDAWTAPFHFSSMSPPRLLPPCSHWATTLFAVHLPSSPPWSPTGSIQLWEFDDAQQLPLQMASTANCSAAVLEAGPRTPAMSATTARKP